MAVDTTKVLATTKKLLGIMDDDTTFDVDILIAINTAVMIITQLGLTRNPEAVVTAATTWDSLIGNDRPELEAVKSYIYFKVRKMFDPPQSSAMANAMNDMISELESRISYATDPGSE